MSATCYKRPHVDIFICIEMGRERNLGIKKEHPVVSLFTMFQSGLNLTHFIANYKEILGRGGPPDPLELAIST